MAWALEGARLDRLFHSSDYLAVFALADDVLSTPGLLKSNHVLVFGAGWLGIERAIMSAATLPTRPSVLARWPGAPSGKGHPDRRSPIIRPFAYASIGRAHLGP